MRMDQGKIAFTAVYLKANSGYVGFIEELPGVNSHGRTLDEARDTLRKLAEVVFDEERRGVEEMIAGKEVVRENFLVPIPRAACNRGQSPFSDLLESSCRKSGSDPDFQYSGPVFAFPPKTRYT
jgi:predicted RNase H-like HicB family nuclease